MSHCLSNLDVEWESVLFEGIEVEDELLATLCQRRDVTVEIYMNGLTLQNLTKKQGTDHKKLYIYVFILSMICKRKVLLCLNIGEYKCVGVFMNMD